MLMIDDLANAWVDINGNNSIDHGESWGYADDYRISPVYFLKEKILRDYPYVKTTFFIPVNRVPETSDHKLSAHFASIKETPEVLEFFRTTFHTPSFEAAYHGFTHGISGNRNRKFIQEWESFESVEQAVEQTARGREMFREVFGYYPLGGKYCGYKKNAFSDESIDKSSFLWWCRHWSPSLSVENGECETDRFELGYFGDNHVIDMPSTIVGSLFNFKEEGRFRKKVKKMLGRKSYTHDEIIESGLTQIENLIKHRQIISIQEHSSPARTDNKRQTPNIYDDAESLKLIFSFLKKRNCWYATATEIASYFEMYNRSSIKITDDLSFAITYTGRQLRENYLSVFIDTAENIHTLHLPDGKKLKLENQDGQQGRIFVPYLPVQQGTYKLEKKHEYA